MKHFLEISRAALKSRNFKDHSHEKSGNGRANDLSKLAAVLLTINTPSAPTGTGAT